MSIDNLTALAARDDLLAVVTAWPALALLVAPQSAADTGPRVSGGDDAANRSPANLDAMDLMREVEDATRFYARCLIDETDDWAPSTSRMPGLLEDVAQRYGHFTTDDDKTALDFTDWAHEARRKVEGMLSDRTQATYLGPCATKECGGELYLRDDREAGTCGECGEPFDLKDQRVWLDAQLRERLMTPAELVHALKVLGYNIPAGTVRRWISEDKVTGEDGLYKLAAAVEVAEKRRMRVSTLV